MLQIPKDESCLSYHDAILPLDYRMPLLMSAWPNLTVYGLQDEGGDFPEARYTLAKLQGVIGACMELLVNAPKVRRREVGSYYLKHVLEERLGVYVPNGACIAACLLLAFKVRPFPPNVEVNISPRWVRDLAEGRIAA